MEKVVGGASQRIIVTSGKAGFPQGRAEIENPRDGTGSRGLHTTWIEIPAILAPSTNSRLRGLFLPPPCDRDIGPQISQFSRWRDMSFHIIMCSLLADSHSHRVIQFFSETRGTLAEIPPGFAFACTVS